ncbi:Protein inscuteable-like protein [Gonioctena quinquepunctata]|nr:Protein inscuteable-like protein [Gonioctena quinquepunctata]
MASTLVMTEFKRSPSRVWWGNDANEWREVSASPGSQDSGFSDTETSPHNNVVNIKQNEETPKKPTPSQRIPKDIFKELASENSKQNLAVNFVEKSTPEKASLGGRTAKTSPKKEREKMAAPNTEPVRKSRFTKNSPKVSRNLFTSSLMKQKECKTHQYAGDVRDTTSSRSLNTSEEVTVDDSYSWRSDANAEHSHESYATQSLPVPESSPESRTAAARNESAPAVLEKFREYEGVTSFNNSLSSDCESELECLFDAGQLESPQHTSTPKTDAEGRMCQRREKLPLRLFLRYQQDRVPPIPTIESDVDNAAVEMWMKEARQHYEQECMTTLQCKSIAGELNQKVSHLAACSTATIRGIISHSRCIEMEYGNLNNGELKQINPQIQSLTGNILDFLKTNAARISPKILQLCDDIRIAKPEVILELISNLVAHWQNARQDLLAKEVHDLVDKLEHPTSELDLRATVTGITSIALRNEEAIELFTRADIIPILLILCEKCEGSSLRTLVLRALSTMCCNSSAVRKFEKFSGVQIVADTLEEQSTPEPEKSEAVALLAQVTAPWLEDNHSVKGLQDYSRKLVKSLTKFASATKCCQNLLLCAAALANLSSMDPKAMKHLIRNKTADSLLAAVKSRGPRASIYLLEQVATLLANMSASPEGRKQLTEIRAPTALLSFLRARFVGEEVEKRLQQKSIIALSRLCGETEAAKQLVELGGVEKLVKMCREKEERFDSDAVLVAALATLRKIADTCGSDVLSVQDAQELVEPKLLDSFLAYSTQNESYV